MMRLTKRVFSAFLAFVMVFTMMPLDVWAQDGQSSNSVVAPMNVVEPDENNVDTYQFYVDGELKDTQYVMSGDDVYAPASPEKEGSKFTGWNTSADGTGDAFTPGQKDDVTGVTYTYYAVFQQVYYVFFLNDEGQVVHTVEAKDGDTVSTADVTFPLPTDQGIVGWYRDPELNDQVQGDVVIDGANITLYPKVAQGSWITFESDGGSYIAPVFVAPGALTKAPEKPTRVGYDFLRWLDEDGREFEFGSTLTDSVTLIAEWQGKPVKYKVFYWKENANNDEYSLDKTETLSGIAGTMTTAGASYNAGKGFYLSSDPDKQLVQKIIEGDGSTIVNVYYDREEYTIEFYRFICNNTSRLHSHRDSCWKIDNEITIKAKYGADISLQWPSNDNYGSAWSVSQGESTMQVHMETMPNENKRFYEPTSEGYKTLTASYYVESLDGQRGEEQKGGVWYDLHHKDVSKGSDSTYITDDDKYAIEGFTFKEYTCTHHVQTGGFWGGGSEPGYDGAKFYYTRDDYTLTFVNGSDETTQTVQYQADISQYGSAPATRPAGVGENYTFQGWYLDEALQTEYDFSGKTMPAYNVTVYAKWAAPEVKVTVYVTMDGTGKTTVLTIPLGSVIDQSELPEVDNREGYTLHGWATKNADGTFVPFNMDQEIHVNTTIYPYFISNEVFSVEYNLNGVDGTAPTDNKSYKEDSYADIQYSGNIEDAIFLYWNTEPNGSGDTYYPGDKMQIKAADAVNNVITLYAIWGDKAPTATLVYNANGGEGGTREYGPYANNSSVKLESANNLGFTYEGHKFLGWSTYPDATSADYEAGNPYIVNRTDTTNGVNTLYAVWEQQYKVTYRYDDSAPDGAKLPTDSGYYSAGDTVQIKTPDSVQNYEFLGWKDKNDNTVSGTMKMPGENVTLTGSWKALTADYVIHHYWNGTTTPVFEDKTGTANIGSQVTGYAKDITGYTLAGDVNSETIIISGTGTNEIIFYYYKNVTLTANDATRTYNGQTQEAKPGYTCSETGVTFDGIEPSGSGKDVDTYPITFPKGTIGKVDTTGKYIVKDTNNGTLTIEPVQDAIVVKVKGNTATKPYTGNLQEVTDFSVTEISGDTSGTFTKEMVSLVEGVEAKASGTEVDTYYMGLTEASFTWSNKEIYPNVSFVVEDGWLKIEPVSDAIVVKVAGATGTKTYNGKPQEVTGFSVTEITGDTSGTFTGAMVSLVEGVEAKASGTTVDTYYMGLTADSFTWSNKEIYPNVSFVVEDGWLKIEPVSDAIVVKVAGATTLRRRIPASLCRSKDIRSPRSLLAERKASCILRKVSGL